MLHVGCYSGVFIRGRYDHALFEPTDQQPSNDLEHPSSPVELDGTQRSMVAVAYRANARGNRCLEPSDTGHSGW